MVYAKRLLCGFALTTGALVAQGPPPAGHPLSPPAKVVTLNVIARDARDQPVGDLGVDDVQVFDQGKPQRVILFRRTEDSRQLSAPLGPHEYSNRSGAAAPHAVVILFDLLNANFAYRGYGAEEIVRALQHIESGDSVYLYLLTANGTLFPVRPLPDPQTEPRATNGAWTQQIKPLLDAAINQVNGFRPIDEQQPPLRIEATYRALEMLAAEMAPLPGRKDVLWISQGVPLVIRLVNGTLYEYMPRLQRLATALDRAGVSINTVDQGDAVGTGSKETLDEFSNVTGGKAYPQRSVEKAIPEVQANPRASYLIEYAAPPPDGKFHKIRVTSARKGIRLQVEQGYSAAAGAPPLPGYADAVLSSPFDASGIGLWAAASTAENAPGVVHLELRVDSRDVMLQPHGDSFSVPLTVIFEAYTAKGQEASAATANITLTRAQREKPSKDDISISQDLDAAAIQKVRVIVVDGGSNQIGSLTIPLGAP
ncbi:MAG TPA: VWA domain-containing protein [Bryobacteraceae bacterium]|nr:VWA domain-containing protein [Bryobacteraceae bacterium]